MKVKRKRKPHNFTLADKTIERIDQYIIDIKLKYPNDNRSRAIDKKFEDSK